MLYCIVMRERISQNWRIITAVLFSAGLVAGAFVLARGFDAPNVAQASTETALLQAIATKDSDGDGLPDWEEPLFGTDPQIVDTFHLGMSDGAAVAQGLIVPKAMTDTADVPSGANTFDANGLPSAPEEGTLTAAFAQSFFSFYLAAKQSNGTADLTEQQMAEVANQAISSLSASIAPAPDFKSAKDLTVSGSGKDALLAFAVSAEAVLLKNTSDADDTDINYLKAALENNDPKALAHIASIAKMYRGSAAGLAVLPVPRELAVADLSLINTLMRLSEIDDDFTRSNTDPLVTILAIHQYAQVTQSLGEAFVAIGKVYAAAHITLPADAPGASFVNMIANVNAAKRAAAKP